jgi:hypothetical protein
MMETDRESDLNIAFRLEDKTQAYGKNIENI